MYQIVSEDPDDASIRVMQQSKFAPGLMVATPAALAALEAVGCSTTTLLARHLAGDWGDVPPEDARMNNTALECGGRLLSNYTLAPNVHIWIISENYPGPENSTSLILPEEY